MTEKEIKPFWNKEPTEVLKELNTNNEGLMSVEAVQRIRIYGPNVLKPSKRLTTLSLFLSQFKSPIIILLILAVILSFFLKEFTDAIIILIIVIVSGILSFIQEKNARGVVAKLLAIVQIKTKVLRDKKPVEIPVEDVVPGDIVLLGAGDIVPGDCLILKSKDLFVNEAILTGETFPVEKEPGIIPADAPLAHRTNSLFMGTHIVSGSAQALVVYTARSTEFGKVSERLKLKPPETEFQRGVSRFGFFLMEVTSLFVIIIFGMNVYLKKPVLDSFLFALALAIGFTPQLLPAIISINLAHGAKGMAKKKVIVKRLVSIENFGSMNILCSDKTGTLTEGMVKLKKAVDIEGRESEKVLFYAYLNAFYQTGLKNLIDEAILNFKKFTLATHKKLDEVPYDFSRKRLSILVEIENEIIMITKGAISNILEICPKAERSEGNIVDISEVHHLIEERLTEFNKNNFRFLGVAYRKIGKEKTISKKDERDMVFLGFLAFFDPPKKDVAQTIKKLSELGVSLKIISGDNKQIAINVAKQIGLKEPKILTGKELQQMVDEALLIMAPDIDIFAEVEPSHKERIILALKKLGNVVGYMGDGINDISALHAADVGISVDSAVDAAKEAADIVLLEKDLNVLLEGVHLGRLTFANTLKYIFMATSANFGNMFSMAGISLFLPFLPLLPKQVLLTNLITDFPEMTIATDNVDKEMIKTPQRWNINFIRRFMIIFGLISSVFDYLTFGALLFLLHASTEQFRTGWFVESVVSAALIVLVIRSRRLFFKSLPGRYLLLATTIIVLLAIILPWMPIAKLFGFVILPISFIPLLLAIIVFYVITAEITKYLFYRKMKSI
ncbi:MAG: magnesium-translocating P-type ATPase [candidate division WOR-3 bacterium]